MVASRSVKLILLAAKKLARGNGEGIDLHNKGIHKFKLQPDKQNVLLWLLLWTWPQKYTVG